MNERGFRFDSGLIRATLTEDGALLADAYVAQPGVYSYRNQDGSYRREYIPADELFAQDSLTSLEAAAVTSEHPDVFVNGDNYRSLIAGSVSKPREESGRLAVRFRIMDTGLIERILSGEQKELSLGKRVQIDPTPGVTPEGERYDAVQRNIRYNHAAVTKAARLGPDMTFRIDSTDSVSFQQDRIRDDAEASKGKRMKTLRLKDGRDIQVSEIVFPALQKLNERSDSTAEEIEGLNKEVQAKIDETGKGPDPELKTEPGKKSEVQDSSLSIRMDALKTENEKLREELNAQASRIDSAVRERSALERNALFLKPDLRVDSMSSRDIRLSVIAEKLPFSADVDTKSLSDDAVNSRFDAVVEMARVAKNNPADSVRVDAAQVEKDKNTSFWVGDKK